jgi:hypothetical protein
MNDFFNRVATLNSPTGCKVEAGVVLDSLFPSNTRVTTIALRYPRFVHSEFMTHRQFSRNASSSRAIPVEKMLDPGDERPGDPRPVGAQRTWACRMVGSCCRSIRSTAWRSGWKRVTTL